MHGFILSAAVAGEGFRETLQAFLLRFHTSPALLRSRRGRREKRALKRKVRRSMPEPAKLSRRAITCACREGATRMSRLSQRDPWILSARDRSWHWPRAAELLGSV
jgi:hypothetical protein